MHLAAGGTGSEAVTQLQVEEAEMESPEAVRERCRQQLSAALLRLLDTEANPERFGLAESQWRMLARLLCVVGEGDGGLGPYGRVLSFVCGDYHKRQGLMQAVLYELYLRDALDTAKDDKGRFQQFDAVMVNLLRRLIGKLDGQDRLLTRTFLEAPRVPERALDLLVELVEDKGGSRQVQRVGLAGTPEDESATCTGYCRAPSPLPTLPSPVPR